MTSEIERDLRARAGRFIDDDVDPTTQAELRALLSAPDLSATDLADRFAGSLEFGTAGLRGILGAGPNRMNRAVILRTTHGLARALLSAVPEAKSRGVVIGFDGRHLSRTFAEDTAAVLAAHGIRAFLFDDVAPTPLTAFAVSHLGAAAGVMVTASHNPREYNGYKVYWSNGAQIIPPIDALIAAEIDRAPAARDVLRLAIDLARAEARVSSVAPSVTTAYLDAVRALQRHPLTAAGASMPIVYTAMHGVGGELARAAFARAGFTNVAHVAEQDTPDPAFPTVVFPNPEEKGAMDLSLALARKTGAELIVANDPDADRLAVAVPFASSPTGYLQLTGNQVGVLLGHYVLTQAKGGEAEAKAKRLVLVSIVSSPLLGVIAGKLGVAYDETLTGFKWIANRAMELELEPGHPKRFVFGYEEALGYTVGDVVRDKDGVSAAVVMAEMAAWLRDSKRTLLTELEAIHRRYGLFVSSQVNLTRPGASGVAEIRAMMDRLRTSAPRSFGPHAVAVIRDYEAQTATRLADGAVSRITLPKSNVLTFDLDGGSRVIARPSGTEPKIKFYFDVREAVGDGEPMAVAEARANATMAELSRLFVAAASA